MGGIEGGEGLTGIRSLGGRDCVDDLKKIKSLIPRDLLRKVTVRRELKTRSREGSSKVTDSGRDRAR